MVCVLYAWHCWWGVHRNYSFHDWNVIIIVDDDYNILAWVCFISVHHLVEPMVYSRSKFPNMKVGILHVEQQLESVTFVLWWCRYLFKIIIFKTSKVRYIYDLYHSGRLISPTHNFFLIHSKVSGLGIF